MPRPVGTPLGLQLNRTARIVGRAFDDALTDAGGSLPTWLVLVSLKAGRASNQRELAEAVGIRQATLSHHLNSLVEQGLVTRERDPDNRRSHLVELTAAGDATFFRLRDAAVAFDRRLRRGLSPDDVSRLEDALGRLTDNVTERERSNA
jgi:MarR family transcriptional regulator for hemolysin